MTVDGPEHADPTVEKNFRAAMSHVAAPVSIVTSVVDGVPWGTTVSAFASLSMDPPMLLISGALVIVRLDDRWEVAGRTAEDDEMSLDIDIRNGRILN